MIGRLKKKAGLPLHGIFFESLYKNLPSVKRVIPPVGWARTLAQLEHMTTVWACEKTVVIWTHPYKTSDRKMK